MDSFDCEEYVVGLCRLLGGGGIVENCDGISAEEFNATLKLKSSSIQGPDWASKSKSVIKKFTEITNSAFITRDTKWDKPTFFYRIKYVCQFSSFKKVSNNNKNRKRNRNCKAAIVIKFQRPLPRTRDVFLKKGYDVLIEIDFKHRHRVFVAKALSYRRTSDETIAQFRQYFEKRMGASEAKKYHEFNILADNELNEESDAARIMIADAARNPLLRTIETLYTCWREEKYGGRDPDTVLEALQKQKEQLESSGTTMVIEEEPLVVAVVTPIMRRAHKERSSSEICYVDSSGSCDQTNMVATFIFSSTKVGGIPLGVVIHSAQTTVDYERAMRAHIRAVGDGAFGGQGYPNIFMTDDSDAERAALEEVFPNSKRLLCSFHVCQAVWRWLWDSKNKIEHSHRQPLMCLFRDLLYSDCEISFEENLSSFKKDKITMCYPNFSAYVNNMINRKTDWALYYRQNLTTRGNNTNNYVEASIRIFKDLVLERCKAFNACALVSFVSDILEKYHKARLLGYANSRDTRFQVIYKNMLKRCKSLTVTKVLETTFHVSSGSDDIFLYTVDVSTQTCDCPIGRNGKFCKHLLAVSEAHGKYFSFGPDINDSDRVKFAELAVGKISNPEFYVSMDKSLPHPTRELIETGNVEFEVLNHNDSVNSKNLSESQVSGSYSGTIDNFKGEIARVVALLEQNPSPYSEKIVKEFTESLKSVTTANAFTSLLAPRGVVHSLTRQRLIAVQPTSRARRTAREGFKSGRKRIQAGRPASNGPTKRKKRKHSLGGSIAKCVPNAKGH